MKTCSKCGEEKPADQFTGRSARCRDCVAAYNRAYSLARYKYDAAFREKKIEAAKKWAKANPAARAAIAKKRNRKAAATEPQKVRARALVNRRVKSGRMPKASALKCARCNARAAAYHHRNGYAPAHVYDVEALCNRCHALADA